MRKFRMFGKVILVYVIITKQAISNLAEPEDAAKDFS